MSEYKRYRLSKDERIQWIEHNLEYSQRRYDEGEITLKEYNRLKRDADKRIKEIRKGWDNNE